MEEIISSDRAVLVSLEFGNEAQDAASLAELRELASTAGAEVLGEFIQRRQKPDAALYLGRGKAEELYTEVKALDANLVIVNEELTPTQQRNLEEAVSVRVVDRTGLILDIFAQRAQTREGKLQVELAQLQYLLPRLAGYSTSLSRLGGG
ncbi:MAG TPA: GTPase HflX, partial [Armatimonadetes bacterium]|nr:GTPase HflX [Armatimonadota bacterium]